MPELKRFAMKLKGALATRNLSYEDVGKALDLHPTTIGRWAMGMAIPRPLHQQRLLSYLAHIDNTISIEPIISLTPHDFRNFNEQLTNQRANTLAINRQKKNSIIFNKSLDKCRNRD